MLSNVPPILFTCVILLGAQFVDAAGCTNSQTVHRCLSSSNPLKECAAVLEQDRFDKPARLALCEAQITAKDFDSASVTLRQGIDRCSGRACQDFRVALSNVDEQRSRANRADPGEAQRKIDAQRAYCTGPLANKRSISACEKILISVPEDAQILTALGKKLKKNGNPADAIVYLQRAQTSGGDKNALKGLLASAEQARSQLTSECLKKDALRTCDIALLPGARDEADIQRQRGKLLANSLNYPGARAALLKAWQLKPDNTATAKLMQQYEAPLFDTATNASLLVLASAFNTLGERDSEQEVLQRILTADPNNTEARKRAYRFAEAKTAAPTETNDIAPTPVTNSTAPPAVRPSRETPAIVRTPTPITATPIAAPITSPLPSLPAAIVVSLNRIDGDGRTH